MFDHLKEIYYVAWADLRFMRHTMVNVLIMSLMAPLLYLLAFGYGMGRGIITEGVSYIAFIVPGIVALTALSASFSSTSSRMNVQRLYYRSFDEMMLGPLRLSSIVIGKSILGVVRGLISCLIIFAIGMMLTSELQFTPLFVLCMIVSCLTFSLLGETAALLAKTHQSMSTFSTLIILPMTFLCGTFFSIGSMPEWLRMVLYALPLTYSSTSMRESALGWSFSVASLAMLVAFGIAFYLANIYLLKTRRV